MGNYLYRGLTIVIMFFGFNFRKTLVVFLDVVFLT